MHSIFPYFPPAMPKKYLTISTPRRNRCALRRTRSSISWPMPTIAGSTRLTATRTCSCFGSYIFRQFPVVDHGQIVENELKGLKLKNAYKSHFIHQLRHFVQKARQPLGRSMGKC